MYIAAVLKPEAIQTVKSQVERLLAELGFGFKTPTGGDLPHHMTINMGELDKSLNDPEIIGKTVHVNAPVLVIDPKRGACALRVDNCRYLPDQNNQWTEIKVSNSQRHITVALKPGVKPKVSNDIFSESFITIKYDFHLEAVITLCD